MVLSTSSSSSSSSSSSFLLLRAWGKWMIWWGKKGGNGGRTASVPARARVRWLTGGLIFFLENPLRIFYWFGEYYSRSLLTQAVLMIVVQSVLLKVALDNRPPSGMRAGVEHAPFSAHGREGGVLRQVLAGRRPYQFWRWPSSRPWVFSSSSELVLFSLNCLLHGCVCVLIVLGIGFVQLLPVPALPHPRPFRDARLGAAFANCGIRSIHRVVGLCGTGDRSHSPVATDIQESASRIV
jgi:hypothetical protein